MTLHRPWPAVTTALLVGIVLALAAAAALLIAGRDGTPSGPPLGAVLGPERSALAAVPVQRGRAAAPVDPAVDLRDPVAVARAYLSAARTTTADDRGRTHLRAAGYAVPGSPPAAVGVVVLDPPPPGRPPVVAVAALDLVAADVTDSRRGYRATLATTPGAGGGATTVSAAYVVLARQPDGRWLVAADTPDVPNADD